MNRPWDTPSALTALLDALEAELLSASKQDVQAALLETGRAQEGSIYELRSLLRDVQTGDRARCRFAILPGGHEGIDTQRH